jgi:hypothetical protein
MRVVFMRPVLNLESSYRVTTLARDERARFSETPPMVKRLAWYTDVSKTAERTERGIWAIC